MKNEIAVNTNDIDKITPAFTCPCCNAHLQFGVRVKVVQVGLALNSEETAAKDGRPILMNQASLNRMQLLTEYAEFLKVSKSLGVFDAFWKAVETAGLGKAGGIPTDPDKYFLQWITKAARQNAPSFALQQCLNGSSGGDLSLWGWQNVSVILQDGLFRVFIPRQLVHGEDIKELAFEGGAVTTKRTMALPQWVRTKYGYVERSGEFANEMRKHSIGGFSL